VTQLLETVNVELGASVAVEQVEELLERVGPDADGEHAWELDLSGCRNVQPGAGYRLGNAMRRWARRDLSVVVPAPGDFSGQWFQTFTRSGIGLALAMHASSMRSPEGDVTDAVREYYAEKGDVSGENYGVRTDLASGGLTPDIDRFAAIFSELAKCVRLEASDLSSRQRTALTTLAHEAVLNVAEHAFASPWADDGRGLSYISLRYYKTLSAASGARGGLREYLARAARAVARRKQDLLGWVELVVCDDGIGVAARQRQDADIYSGPIEDEDQALDEALNTEASIKLEVGDVVTLTQPGLGYSLIADALIELDGYAALRSGRRLARLDGTNNEADAFRLEDAPLGLMPGTVLHTVIPIRDPQLRIA
jgi:hypothetical protein